MQHPGRYGDEYEKKRKRYGGNTISSARDCLWGYSWLKSDPNPPKESDGYCLEDVNPASMPSLCHWLDCKDKKFDNITNQSASLPKQILPLLNRYSLTPSFIHQHWLVHSRTWKRRTSPSNTCLSFASLRVSHFWPIRPSNSFMMKSNRERRPWPWG